MKVVWLLLSLSALAFGHTDTLESGGFGSGFLHPMSGLDHVLAMVGVGIVAFLASQKGYLLLFSFMGAMVISATIGFLGFSFPFVEEGILLSIAVVFALIGYAKKISIYAIIGIVAFFGMFHGFAHGAEFQTGSFLSYIFGFSLSTLFLHVTGIALAYAYNKSTLKKQAQIPASELA